MARLRVRQHGKVIQDLQLSAERSYVAGRREDCEIRLQTEKGISREHFKLAFADGHWQLEVLSRFGDVIADGEKVQTLTLSDRAVFLLNPYEFEFSEASTELVATSRQPSEGDGSESGDRTYVGVSTTVPFVRVADGNGETKEMFKLEGGDTWIAGRDASCDIIIRDPRVSRRQFELTFQNEKYYILDLGSVNGTLVNGSPVSSAEPVAVKSGDAVSVLDNHLYFELHDPNFKARMEMVKVSARNPLASVNHDVTMAPSNYNPHPMMSPMPAGFDPNVGPEPKKKFDFEKHRVKLIVGAIALLAVAYLFSGSSGGPAPASTSPGLVSKPQADFNKLPPEKQMLVKQTYLLSKNLFMQGKYELSKAEISKIYELVPEYEGSKDLERLVNEALEIQKLKMHEDELEKSRAETEDKISKQVAECKAKINANYTASQLEECLSPVLQFNPDHPAILELRQSVDQIVALKQTRDMQKQEYQSQVQKLKGLYGRAETSQKEKQYLKAIKEFQVVASSSLPDPTELKSLARRQVASLQQTLKQKTDQYDKEAEHAYKDQKLKDAILTLRKGLEVDPNNDTSKEKIERYTLELKKQMMVLYQEGVLEESYGNVDGGENRPGAKDKWKKIMDLDIPDGDYYAKAKMKLKKYGAL
jgi:pSer/pThr/pTyr-binding forkhead associated (FHA) protein